MSMYEVYSNLRSCIEDVEKGGSLDARDHLALLQARKRLELSIVQRAS